MSENGIVNIVTIKKKSEPLEQAFNQLTKRAGVLEGELNELESKHAAKSADYEGVKQELEKVKSEHEKGLEDLKERVRNVFDVDGAASPAPDSLDQPKDSVHRLQDIAQKATQLLGSSDNSSPNASETHSASPGAPDLGLGANTLGGMSGSDTIPSADLRGTPTATSKKRKDRPTEEESPNRARTAGRGFSKRDRGVIEGQDNIQNELPGTRLRRATAKAMSQQSSSASAF